MEVVFAVGAADEVLRVQCPAGTPWRAVAPDAAAALGVAPESLTVAGQPVPDEAVVGHPPLVRGAALGTTTAPSHPLLAVHVVGGPSAGRTRPLGAGEVLVVGRDPSCDVVLDDPTVSRRHALLRCDADGVAVTDAGSANGTVRCGETLRVGRSTLAIRPPAEVPLPRTAAGDGTVVLARPPRLEPPAPPEQVFERPAAPAPLERPALPVLSFVLPAVAVALLALVTGSRTLLLLGVLAPLSAAGMFAGDWLTRRRSHRRAVHSYELQLREVDDRIDVALAAEQARRHDAAPDLAAVCETARRAGGRLWERVDGLQVRLGTGTQLSAVLVDGRPQPIAELPLVLDLAPLPSVGIVGAADQVRGLARAVLAQLVTLHPPDGVAVEVLGPQQEWGWTRWLPHTGGAGTTRVLVVDATAGPLVAGPADVVLWLAEHATALPAGCRALVTLPDAGTLRLEVSGAAVSDGVPDLLAADLAAALARDLAPLRVPATAGGCPAAVPWSAAAGIDPGAGRLTELWAAPPQGRVAIGVGSGGAAVALDLRTDGPHLLVAGTTGSGKSELLRTLVAGLAATHAPDDLSVLLVDYKGGAAFAGCADLPHVAGLVTDLEPDTAARALTGLGAELRRRERLLAAEGVADVEQLPRGRLPRLVVVLDEFATLAAELPDFLPALVGLARRGRSLGLHLVLATQRPQGCVTAEIRANVATRICLAVTSPEDSRDVIDAPDAAHLGATRGRAVIRRADGRLEAVQVGHVGAPVRPVEPAVRVSRGRLADPPPPPAAVPTELQVLTAAASAAAGRLGARKPLPPWLPPLPERLPLSRLPAGSYALADDPPARRQPARPLDLTGGRHLLIAGAPGSGRTTAVRALIGAAIAGAPDVHCYVLDGRGDLADLAELAQVGAVVAAGDLERVERLLALLTDRSTGPVLLAVDGWDRIGDDGLRDELLGLLDGGRQAGLTAVITGDRGVLSGRLAALVPDRLVLRLADAADCPAPDAVVRAASVRWPPGRGWDVRSGLLVQVARPDARPAIPPRTAPPPVAPIPLAVSRADVGGAPLAGPGGRPVRPELREPAFLVLGPPRSGRSTALAALAADLLDGPPVPVVLVLPRPSPLEQLADRATVVRTPDDARAIEALAGQKAVVVVDDAELLVDTPVGAALERFLAAARDTGGLLVAAAGADDVASAFRGWPVLARRSRTGLILAPTSPLAADALGSRLSRAMTAGRQPPGRGVLVVDGAAALVQVAADGTATARPPRG